MTVSTDIVFDLSLAKSSGSYTMLAEFWENGKYEEAERAAIWKQSIVFETNTYYPSDLSIILPSSSNSESLTRARISNVEGKVGRMVRKPKGEIIVRMILIEVNAGTVLNDTRNAFRFDSISITLKEVSGVIKPRLSVEEPFPPQRFPRNVMPGTWYIQS